MSHERGECVPVWLRLDDIGYTATYVLSVIGERPSESYSVAMKKHLKKCVCSIIPCWHHNSFSPCGHDWNMMMLMTIIIIIIIIIIILIITFANCYVLLYEHQIFHRGHPEARCWSRPWCPSSSSRRLRLQGVPEVYGFHDHPGKLTCAWLSNG